MTPRIRQEHERETEMWILEKIDTRARNSAYFVCISRTVCAWGTELTSKRKNVHYRLSLPAATSEAVRNIEHEPDCGAAHRIMGRYTLSAASRSLSTFCRSPARSVVSPSHAASSLSPHYAACWLVPTTRLALPSHAKTLTPTTRDTHATTLLEHSIAFPYQRVLLARAVALPLAPDSKLLSRESNVATLRRSRGEMTCCCRADSRARSASLGTRSLPTGSPATRRPSCRRTDAVWRSPHRGWSMIG